MLLDQKRTKRIVQVVAILTSIAFAGTIFVVMGLVLFGGGSSPEREVVDEAKSLVERQPDQADSWDQLASAHLAAEEYEEALVAARRAVELAPDSYRTLGTLVLVLNETGRSDEAIDALEDFTRRHPDHVDAFLQLGTQAQDANRNNVARLAYIAFLRLEPDSSRAETVRQLLEQLDSPQAEAAAG